MKRRLVSIIIIWLLLDIYFYQAVKNVFADPSVWLGFWVIEILIFAIVIVGVSSLKRTVDHTRLIFSFFSLLLIFMVPKLVAAPVLLLNDLVRFTTYIIHTVKGPVSSTGEALVLFYPGRNRLLDEITLWVAALPFASLIWGIVNGKYNYRVHKLNLVFPDLPEAFDGFTITQLSDIHSGSFDNKKAVERGIDLANAQKSDLMLFTGDLVNNMAEEMDRWKASFARLKGSFGQYSVLGNHDYGDYIQWETPEAKVDNLNKLKSVHKEIGFRLLLNENVRIEKGGQHISLIGVENWGKGSFAKHGDLDKAAAGVDSDDFKILMSHDPSHWKAVVLDFPSHIHLTLSGHTHGMQFGIEFPFFKWSPVKYIYPEWAGTYHEQNRYINVNRGFGFLGYPGRVGILPEITVITLRKGQAVDMGSRQTHPAEKSSQPAQEKNFTL